MVNIFVSKILRKFNATYLQTKFMQYKNTALKGYHNILNKSRLQIMCRFFLSSIMTLFYFSNRCNESEIRFRKKASHFFVLIVFLMTFITKCLGFHQSQETAIPYHAYLIRTDVVCLYTLQSFVKLCPKKLQVVIFLYEET